MLCEFGGNRKIKIGMHEYRVDSSEYEEQIERTAFSTYNAVPVAFAYGYISTARRASTQTNKNKFIPIEIAIKYGIIAIFCFPKWEENIERYVFFLAR